MEKKKLRCPAGPGEMKLTNKQKHMNFKGVDIDYPVGVFYLPDLWLRGWNTGTGGRYTKNHGRRLP